MYIRSVAKLMFVKSFLWKFAILFILLFCPGLHPQDAVAQTNLQQIDEFLNRGMQKWNIPNASVIIVTGDSVLFQKAYGDAAGNPNSNYLIGSVSKPFTALTVMQLVESGVVDLDAPVQKYLPWFTLKDEALGARITIRHLLNQTTGIPRSAGFFTPEDTSQAEIEREYRNYLETLNADASAIGKTHIYCNLNYQILGQLIQNASGLPYGEYMKENVFLPLGMEHSYATYAEAKQAGLIQGYQYLFGFPMARSFRYKDAQVPAGDIASNTGDLGKFLQSLLNDGRFRNGSLISQELLKQMHTPVSNRYGMGFSIGDWNGLHSVRHSGLSRNYSSMINILPEQNYGIAILTNINSFFATRKLMDGIIRRLNRQESVTYTPYEMYFRYLILGILVWSLVDLSLKSRRWYRQRLRFYFSARPKHIITLIGGLLLAISWLFIIPYFANIPLSKMPELQPDLGYGLIVGSILGVFSTLIQYVVKSNEQKDEIHKP